MSKTTNRSKYAYAILTAVCLLQMVTSGILLQCIGIFVGPVSAGLGVSSSTFLLYVTCMFIVATLVLPKADVIYKKLGARRVMLLSGVINGVGIILFSFCRSIVPFCVIAAFLGIPTAFALFYIVPILVSAWFGKSANFFIGFAFAFIGVGGIVFNQIGGAIIASAGWERAYLVLGIIALVLGVIAGLLTKEPSAGDAPGSEAEADGAGQVSTPVLAGVDYSKAVKSLAFILIAVFAFLFQFSTGINPLIAGFAQIVGGDSSYAVTAATIGTVGATVAGFIIGAINSKSTKAGVVVSAGAGLLGMLLFFVSGSSIAGVYIATFLSVFAFTVATSMTPAVTMYVFGGKDFDRIYAKISTVSSIPPIIASVACAAILNGTSYSTLWLVGAAIFAVVLISGMLAIGEKRKLS